MTYQQTNEITKLALATGQLKDCSYTTPSWGRIESWRGQVIVAHNSRTYLVKGYGPQGNAEMVTRDGGIRITEIPTEKT